VYRGERREYRGEGRGYSVYSIQCTVYNVCIPMNVPMYQRITESIYIFKIN
jgi:hypothetical protein